MPLHMISRFFFWFDPYSVEGLRHRAKKLPDCPYKILLELCAVQLEKKAVSKEAVQKAVEYFRSGNEDLLKSGVGVLKLSHEQIQEVLSLLKTGTIKDYKDLVEGEKQP